MSAAFAAADFAVRPLSEKFAAEVVGLDLCRPLDEATRDTVYAAFVRYHVLAFRDQKLDPEEQIAFTEQFGTLERHTVRNLLHRTDQNFDAAMHPRVLHRTCLRGTVPV